MSKDEIKFHKPSKVSDVTVLDAHIAKFRYKTHAHDDYAIGVTLDGLQCFKCNGEDYKVKKGGVIQINPEEPHDGFAERSEGYTYRMFYISRDAVNDLFEDSGEPFRFTKTVTDDPYIQRAVSKLSSDINANDSDPEASQDILNTFILDLISRNSPHHLTSYSPAEFDLVERAIHFIYQNLDCKLNLEDLCSVLNISKYHFIRTFKKITHRTPYQFIIDLKLDKVRKELEQGMAPKDLAIKYGFYDLTHLIKRFKSAYGITPYKYQKYFK